MFEESVSSIPSSSSLWESMNSWFTPTVLFVLLNFMIGTIAFTSSLANNHHKQQQTHNDLNQPPKNNIVRSPSVIQRLKSINFYTHCNRSHEPQKPNPDSDTLFNLEQTQEAHSVETHSHYFFHENPQNTPQSQSHYIFEQNPQVTQSRFDFEEKDPNTVRFQPAVEEKVEKEDELIQSMDEVYSQLTGSHFSRTKSDTEPASGAIPVKLPAKMRKSASSKSAFGHFQEEEVVEARRPATVREMGNAKIAEGDEEVDAKADDFINKFKQQLKLQRLDLLG